MSFSDLLSLSDNEINKFVKELVETVHHSADNLASYNIQLDQSRAIENPLYSKEILNQTNRDDDDDVHDEDELSDDDIKSKLNNIFIYSL